ncbi:hypothetical protein F8158_30745 [Bacillus cereus]|uniref:Group-specific protein n=1 Tax=Bacillus cereus TaxID=1396 RepID=A0AB34CWG3_BACCE|nr:hypothetical protein [Bacillus cereus]KAB2489850.1 hypothetical protein F8158_30745 [Bacillus cereus]
MKELNFKDRCIQILAIIPTIIFFLWSIYYCFHLFVGVDIPGVNPISQFILGWVTLFMAIGSIIYIIKPNADALNFFVKTVCGLIGISIILFADKITYLAKIFIESL